MLSCPPFPPFPFSPPRTSRPAEQLLLTKLKTECGYQFTSKLETMFGDVKLSREKMADFRAQLAAAGRHPEVDMSVQVGGGGWGG